MAGKRGNGEGSIRQRANGSWEARFTRDGESKSLYAKTRQEAARKLAAALRDYDKGLPITRDERQTVKGFLTTWLEGKEATLDSPRTWDRYEEHVRLHLIPSLGRITLTKLTPQDVQRLYTEKLAAGLSSTTVHHMHAVLHTALETALRQGLVQRNVCDLVDAPRIRKQQMKIWTPEQARTFLAATTSEKLSALYILALSTGMRQAELFGLRWTDVDFDGKSLSVTTTVQRSRRVGTFVKEPKTATSRRNIALTTQALEALKAHRAHQLEERLALGAAWKDTGLVFTDSIGGPLRGNNVERRHFGPMMRKAGVPRIRFHDLRHTAATLMLLRGVHPKVVSEMLGHASVTITLNLYSHVLPNMQREAASAMEGVLWGS
jgi:integrase